jgi:hypothetical protein
MVRHPALFASGLDPGGNILIVFHPGRGRSHPDSDAARPDSRRPDAFWQYRQAEEEKAWR